MKKTERSTHGDVSHVEFSMDGSRAETGKNGQKRSVHHVRHVSMLTSLTRERPREQVSIRHVALVAHVRFRGLMCRTRERGVVAHFKAGHLWICPAIHRRPQTLGWSNHYSKPVTWFLFVDGVMHYLIPA